jgi:phage-related protein
LGSKRKTNSTSGAHRAEPAPKPAYDDWDWTRQAEKEFDAFPEMMQGNFLDLIERVMNRQTRPGAGDVKHLGRGIYELRDRIGSNHYRILWFVDGRVCVAVTCFYKNSQQTEKKDIDRALQRRKAYLATS